MLENPLPVLVSSFGLTNDPSDVVPHRQAVSLGLFPAVVIVQVEGEPEEEGIVD